MKSFIDSESVFDLSLHLSLLNLHSNFEYARNQGPSETGEYAHQSLCHLPRYNIWERSDSVAECLSRDRGAAGSSLTGVTVLCP